MSEFTVTVECPRCSTEIEAEVEVSGSFRPARGPTYWSGGEPAEQPDVDYYTPAACEHEPDDNDDHTAGPYTEAEKDTLVKAIVDAALERAQEESEQEYSGRDEPDYEDD